MVTLLPAMVTSAVPRGLCACAVVETLNAATAAMSKVDRENMLNPFLSMFECSKRESAIVAHEPPSKKESSSGTITLRRGGQLCSKKSS